MVYPESKIVKDKLELIWVYLSSKVTIISSFLSTFLVYKLLFFTGDIVYSIKNTG